MALRERIKDVLDEARMVVLVVQVLLGFQFRVVLERRFDSLAHIDQLVHVGSLGLLVAAFALAVSPATFHRIAEEGNDTARAVRFASRMVSLALLPFALAFGVSLFVVTGVIGTAVEAVVAGLAGVASALAFWYVWPMMQRQSGPPSTPERQQPTEISVKIDTLTEARMVLPGAQALGWRRERSSFTPHAAIVSCRRFWLASLSARERVGVDSRPSRLSPLSRHVDPDGGPRPLTGRASLHEMRWLVRRTAGPPAELSQRDCSRVLAGGEYRADRRCDSRMSEPGMRQGWCR